MCLFVSNPIISNSFASIERASFLRTEIANQLFFMYQVFMYQSIFLAKISYDKGFKVDALFEDIFNKQFQLIS